MAEDSQDIWSRWLLKHRFGGNPERLKAVMDYLLPVRERVLAHAALAEQEALLDVGCGDGLIGFGALAANPTCHVIFSDVSPALLQEVQTLAREQDLLARCRFICSAAETLSDVAGNSVDAVTTRSVLIYVAEKQRAFDEFYRVLRPGGRLSIFEPINSFARPQADNWLWGYDVTPIAAIAEKVKAVTRQLQPPETDPMLIFTERDLVAHCEAAGFGEIRLDLQIEVKRRQNEQDWQTLLQSAFNPKVPTVAEILQTALTPGEADTFTAYMRPLYESEPMLVRSAVAYLWAVKSGRYQLDISRESWARSW
jgi:arsenite methyltransferase